MLFICITLYLLISIPALMMIWSMLILAKWDDAERGYDILDDHIPSFES